MARGVPVRMLSLVFAVLIGLVTALAVPVVGAILVLSVMIAPGAAAARVTANPLLATALAVAFAELALVGGTVLSLAPGLPVSGYVAAIAFACYVGRAGRRRRPLRRGVRSTSALAHRATTRRGGGGRPRPAPRPRPRTR